MAKTNVTLETGSARRLAVTIIGALAAGFAQTGWALADAAGPPTPVAAAAEAPAGTTATTGQKMTPELVRAAIAEAEKKRLAQTAPDPELVEALRDRWGVEVIGIDLTSAGYMLDFRFRVVDAEKALPLFDHRIKPYVVADKSDIKLPIPMAPKVGAFRPTNRGKNIKADKTYYMVFANPDSYVKPGEKVSVVIGDFRAANLTVR
jgi:hypothetical protein